VPSPPSLEGASEANPLVTSPLSSQQQHVQGVRDRCHGGTPLLRSLYAAVIDNRPEAFSRMMFAAPDRARPQRTMSSSQSCGAIVRLVK